MKHQNSYKNKILFSFLILLVAITSGIVVWSMQALKKEVEARTLSYVSDVSGQLALDIDHRLTEAVTSLDVIADSLIRLDSSNPALMQDFLYRKSQQLSFDSLIITDTSDITAQTNSQLPDLFSMEGIQASLHGKNGVTFLDEQSILYSVPIYKNGQIIGTLSGLRGQANMQSMLTSSVFLEQCLSCIINENGEVAISPTNLDAFMELDHLYENQSDTVLAAHIDQMKSDMQNQFSGGFIYTSENGKQMVLTYSPMENYHWVLLTLLPADVISGNINRMMTLAFLLSGFILLLLSAFLLILYMVQRTHTRKLRELAFCDDLTNGMNNTAFRLRCEDILKKAAPGTYTILLFNIKNFKVINSYFGSRTGNLILKEIMQVLQNQTENRGIAARAEADNFFVCLRENDTAKILENVESINSRIHARIRPFFTEKRVPYFFILQSGAYLVNDPDLDITIIQDRAKLACQNRTEIEDGICKFYDDSLMIRQEKNSELNGLFSESLANHDFHVYLQPKICTSDKSIAGAEALVRWNHPEKGMIYPSDFIPLFESNGKICQLDIYIFEEICRTLDLWRREGFPLYPIAINLSRQHFHFPDFFQVFADILNKYQIPASLLEFELTESIFFDDNGIENVKRSIKEMHALGFSCSLDDFGSGYSSLGLLMDFDMDTIKLDRSFFRNIQDQKAQGVITAAVDLVRKLGAKTVAEGIETPEQLRFIEKIQCDMIQGYIYSKPLSIPEFERWSSQYREDIK